MNKTQQNTRIKALESRISRLSRIIKNESRSDFDSAEDCIYSALDSGLISSDDLCEELIRACPARLLWRVCETLDIVNVH